MIPFHLVETTTEDKLIHQGIYFAPQKKAKRALLWIHGLTSNFYSNIPLLNEFAKMCDVTGYGFAAFNNRGHDIFTGIKRLDKRKPKGYSRIDGGAGVEVFKDCVYDIASGIDFLVDQGFKEVVVIGHSTGANKVSYFAGKKDYTYVVAYVLASPASDRLDPSLSKEKLIKDMVTMQEMANSGEGDKLVSGYHVFPATPKRFLSSFRPNELEDQFDYGDERPRMKYFSKIKKPLLVVIGDQDEYLDRSASVMLSVFDRHQHSSRYKSIVLKNTLHSYNGKEKEFVTKVVDWTKSL